jgi:hypothetical protein
MQVQFNRPATISGVTYGKGQHAVPDEARGDWFFNALVKDGDAVVLRADYPAPAAAPAVVEADWPSMDETAQVETDILAGTVQEVQVAIVGLDVETLKDLLAREQAGKMRKTVIQMLNDAIGDA